MYLDDLLALAMPLGHPSVHLYMSLGVQSCRGNGNLLTDLKCRFGKAVSRKTTMKYT